MAQKTIAELDELTLGDSSTILPVDSGIQTYKMTAGNLYKTLQQVLSFTSTERDALVSPPEGMEIYNSSQKCKQLYTGSSWVNVGSQTGQLVPLAGQVAPAGFLAADGSDIDRGDYADLLAAITITQTGTRSSGNPEITGLADTSMLRAGMPVEGTDIPADAVIDSVDSGTQITLDMNATGSGTSNVVIFPWGAGDGTDTFTLPDTSRRTLVGTGGSGTSDVDSNVGAVGGEEAHSQTGGEMASHGHSINDPAHSHLANVGGNGGDNISSIRAWSTNGSGTYYQTQQMSSNYTGISINANGSGDPANVMQPSAVVLYAIKF